MNFIQKSNNNQERQLEIWSNPEQKEQFDKNIKEFKNKYEQKLKNILPEGLVWKISGSFELSWDLNKQIENLKNEWLSEDPINSIKNFLNNNISISKENLDKINQELNDFSNKKNLDMKLWDLIWKATRIAEGSENDDLFDKVIEARKVQQNWSLKEKNKIIEDLEWFVKELDNNSSQEIQEENLVEDVDSWNDKWFFEEWIVTWDFFSKDNQVESNDYWNVKSKNNENFSEVNWEYFPLLENLKNSWDISKESFDSVNKDLSSKSGQDKIDFFKSFIQKLPNSENKENILKKFDNKNETITEENFENTDFAKDVWKNLNLDKSIWWLELILAENYININDKNNSKEKNTEKNIEMTLEISKNKIVKSKSVDFKNNNAELIWEISQEKDLNKKYWKLKQLYKEWLKEDAKSGWKKWKEEMERKKEDLIWQYKEVLEQIKKLEKIWNKEELEKLNKEKQKIEQEAKEAQNLIKELEKIAKETDLDIWKDLQENNNTKKE